MALPLLTIGINLLISAALWGLGMLLRKHRHIVTGEIQDTNVQVSTYGVVKPILYGQCKVAMQLVYAEPMLPYKVDQPVESGKGMGGGDTITHTYYTATFAGILGIAPDPAVFGELKLLKLWADDKLSYNILDSEGMTTGPWWGYHGTYYSGSENQQPDWTLQNRLGVTPGYCNRPLIVINNMNVTYFGNRLPVIRALVGPATARDAVDVVNDVPAWWGDGENQARSISLQIVMSKDFSYYICFFPDWSDYDALRVCFLKVDAYSGQMLSEGYYLDDEWSTLLCEGQTVGTAFGWHHPCSMDELGRVYTNSCDGYGRFYRLNSDTWAIEARSPEWCNDPDLFEEETGMDPQFNYWTHQMTRVSRNPIYPYLWVSQSSVEQNDLGPQAIVLVNRETMANPFDESSWGYLFWPPYGRTYDAYQLGYNFKNGAFCLNDEDGSCFVLWTAQQDPYEDPPLVRANWLGRLWPDGSRNDVDVNDVFSIYDLSVSWHHMCYDPDTDQLIIMVGDPSQDELGGIVFYNGDLEFIEKVSLPVGAISYGNHGEDGWQQGIVDGFIFFSSNYGEPGPVIIYKLDVRSKEITEVCSFGDDVLPGGTILSTVYNPIKGSLVVEWWDHDNYWDSFLKEILLDRVITNGVDLADIVYDLCRRSGMPHAIIDVEDLRGTEVKGYVVGQDQSARDAISALMEAFVFDAVDEDGQVIFKFRGGSSARTIQEEDLAIFMAGEEKAEPLEIEYPDEYTLPRRVEVTYPDINRKHEPGEQYYERFVTASTQIKKINTPILMNATDALQLAHKALKFAWNAKICRFSVGSEHLHLSPTDVVTIDRTEASYRVMLMESRRHRLLTQWQGIVEGMTYTWGEEVLLEVDQWVIT